MLHFPLCSFPQKTTSCSRVLDEQSLSALSVQRAKTPLKHHSIHRLPLACFKVVCSCIPFSSLLYIYITSCCGASGGTCARACACRMATTPPRMVGCFFSSRAPSLQALPEPRQQQHSTLHALSSIHRLRFLHLTGVGWGWRSKH